MPEESHFHQKMLLTLYCFLCAHCSMERPCCECHVYLAVLRQTRWGKTFPYDTQRQEIRSEGMQGSNTSGGGWRAERLSGCNLSWQCSSGMAGGRKEEYLVLLCPETRAWGMLWSLESTCSISIHAARTRANICQSPMWAHMLQVDRIWLFWLRASADKGKSGERQKGMERLWVDRLDEPRCMILLNRYGPCMHFCWGLCPAAQCYSRMEGMMNI